MGKSAYRASLEAADEIGLAVIAISLSIAAIFAPVSFMGGIAGQYFRQFGLTVAIAVMFSLLVARFITPVVAAYFLRAPHDHDAARTAPVMRVYTRLVRASVRWRWMTMLDRRADLRGVAVVDPTAAFGLHSRRRRRPRAAGGRTAAGLAARRHRPGHARRFPTSCARCRRCGRRSIFGGTDPRRRRGAAQGDLRHQFRPQVEARGDAEGIADPHRRACSPTQPDIRFWFLKDNGQRDLQLIVAGPDIDVDQRHRQPARQRDARRFRCIENPISTAELDRPELQITPKRQVAADLGVSTEALSDDDPRRDARRHRRQSRQVQRRRPAGADPRRTRSRPRAPHRRVAGPARADRRAARRRRCRWSPISRSATARPRSTATTARAA